MSSKREYVFKSTDKYLKNLDGGLAGRTFRLAMDDGEEYELRFVSADVVEWRRPGEPLRWEKYGCLRSDDQTWFVAAILSGTKLHTCVTLVLDEVQSLVTMAISRIGFYPNRPRLAVVDYIFGAIRVQGQPLPMKRHGFTRELVDKKITWHYSSGFINTHIYPSERYCRIRPLQAGRDYRPKEEIEQEEREKREGLRPKEMLYEEPTRFIRIRDGMYLMSFVEDNMNRVDPTRGGNNLMVLTNMLHGFDCGRTFCLNGQMKLEHGLFKAYGEFIEEDIPVEHEPTPYRV